MSVKHQIKLKIKALEFEREGYKTFGKDDRVKAVDAELTHWRAELKKADGADPSDDVEGVISEAEAAKEGPVDGEAIANANAEAHRKQKYGVGDTPVIDEAEAADEPTDAAQQRANAKANELRSEKAPAPFEETIVTEAQVVAAEKRAGAIDEGDAPVDATPEAPKKVARRAPAKRTPAKRTPAKNRTAASKGETTTTEGTEPEKADKK